jgi:hypothetical protein
MSTCPLTIRVPLAGRGPAPARRLISPQEAAASNRKLTAKRKLLILPTDVAAAASLARQNLDWPDRATI